MTLNTVLLALLAALYITQPVRALKSALPEPAASAVRKGSPLFNDSASNPGTNFWPVPQTGPKKTAAMESFSRTPLYFEANHGQIDPSVQFVAKTGGMTLFLTGEESVMVLSKTSGPALSNFGNRNKEHNTPSTQQSVVRMKFAGGNRDVQGTGADKQVGVSNYFIGATSNGWKTDVPHYGKVILPDVYRGIDVVYYGNQRNVEYDFVVKPGADPSRIELAFQGAEPRIDSAGDLVLATSAGKLKQHRPKVYQEIGGRKFEVAAAYKIHGDNVGFELARYDASHPVVIDPVLNWSTYLGGSADDKTLGAECITVDSTGAVFVAGYTYSSNFPTSAAYDSVFNGGGRDAFVSKFDAAGSLVWSTFLGGSDEEYAVSTAVDSTGALYVTGDTYSSDFPTLNAYDSTFNGGVGTRDAFVVKINPAGNSLAWSTYFGGSGLDEGRGIAVDSSTAVYVMGATSSGDLPMVNAYDSSQNGGWDSYVVKFNPSGNSLAWSTYLGGSAEDYASSIAVDSTGAVYVGGSTMSSDFPIVNAYQAVLNGGWDIFVSKIKPDGSGFAWSTYLGGSGNDFAHSIAIDSGGSVYLIGETSSTDAPTVNPYDGTPNGGLDIYVAKFNPAGDSLAWATYLGGAGDEYGNSIAVDSVGAAYVTGETHSSNFPTINAPQPTSIGNADAFLTKFNPAGSTVAWSTYLGGLSDDVGVSTAVHSSGAVYVAGYSTSADFPTVNAYDSSSNGGSDVFIAKLIQPQTTTSINSISPSPGVVDNAYLVSYSVTSTYPGVISGTISVTDGAGATCSGSAPIGSCWLTSTTVGAKTITATYSGDSTYNSSSSTALQNIQSKLATTTTVGTISPEPSTVGQAYSVAYTVTSAGGTPTGNVTVSDGAANNICTVAAATCSITSTTAGAKTITVTYAGDTNFAGSSNTKAHTVNTASTTTTVGTISPEPSTVGQAYSVAYTVTSAGGTPTGNVTVSDGAANNICTVAAATCSITSTTAGAKTITVTYAGDTNFAGSSNTKAHTVNTASTTTTVGTISPEPSTVGQAYSVAYTVTSAGGTPTGNVTVSDGAANNICTVAAATCSITSTTAGAKTITVTYAGDTNFAGSSNTKAHTVNTASTTTTVGTISPEPSTVGQAYSVAYTVTSAGGTPTGNVTVSDGAANNICTVAAATCSITSTTAGAKTITVTYAGDTNFAGSSNTKAHTVNTASTTTTVGTISLEPSTVGQAYSVAYTVTSAGGTPTGNVTVSDGAANNICTVAAATCSITSTTAGAKTITVTYAGDTNFAGSSNTKAHTVNTASTTTTVGTISPEPSTVGQAYSVAYTVTSAGGTPTGNVTVSDGAANNICTVAAATCSITSTTAGAKTITVTYAGDINFAGSSNTKAHTVNTASTTTTVGTISPEPSTVGQAYSVAYTVTSAGGTPTGNVTVSDGAANNTCTVAAATCSITSTTAGAKTITVTYAGDINFAGSSNTKAHTVNTAVKTLVPSKVGIFRSSAFMSAEDVNGNIAWDPGTDKAFFFGSAGDTLIQGDWDGSGTTKLGIFRPSVAMFALDMNGNGVWDPGVDKFGFFGGVGDMPIVGDWTGDGKTKIGIYRPATQLFALDFNNNLAYDAGTDKVGHFGISGDQPILGDWTGDGITKIGIYRPSASFFALDINNNLAWDSLTDKADVFGVPGDAPIVGDWTGDGITKVGIYRAASSLWAFDVNNNLAWDAGTDKAGVFGATGDTALVGDWDGTGVSRAGVYRPSVGLWGLDLNGNLAWDAGTDLSGVLGATGDTPLIGKW